MSLSANKGRKEAESQVDRLLKNSLGVLRQAEDERAVLTPTNPDTKPQLQFTCVWDKDSKINSENSQQMEVPHSNLTLNF
jgi:hypothetical protein